MRLGVCYYPEQWPEARWNSDAAQMVAAGLELVRIGEFAWTVYEPERGLFAWGWLDRAIDALSAAGLSVILGTPTATPPVWLVRERPEVLSVGPDGRRRAYGSRRHTCPTAPAYREEAARVVTALAQRYGEHPAVVAWQLDNEPGNHDSARCWCDACQDAFERWLEDRYGTVEALNTAWGGAFWSGAYPSLAAVRLPVPTVTAHSPSLLLAHRRFASEMAVQGLAEQRTILAEASPGRDLTTNLYAGDTSVNAFQVAGATGLAAVDSYPHGTSGPIETAFTLDLARGSAGPDGRLWIMEQQPGPVNWTPENPLVPAGQVRLWGWQAALHGAQACLFFRWRAGRTGQEQYHTGLLRHDGTPDRGLDEVARLSAELRAAGDLSRGRGDAALLYAFDDVWALEIDPHRQGLTHRDLMLAAYSAALRLGYRVDVVAPEQDLSGYDMVLAPALHLATAPRLQRLAAALDAGALVVLGPRSLVSDDDDVWLEEPLPGGLAGRLGARVGEFGSTASWPAGGQEITVTVDNAAAPAGPWAEVLVPFGPEVEVLATYAGRHLTGLPAAVRREGLVYLGCSSAAAWVLLLGRLTARTAGPADQERVMHDGRAWMLDHAALEVHRPAEVTVAKPS